MQLVAYVTGCGNGSDVIEDQPTHAVHARLRGGLPAGLSFGSPRVPVCLLYTSDAADES